MDVRIYVYMSVCLYLCPEWLMRASRCISSCAVDSAHHIFAELDQEDLRQGSRAARSLELHASVSQQAACNYNVIVSVIDSARPRQCVRCSLRCRRFFCQRARKRRPRVPAQQKKHLSVIYIYIWPRIEFNNLARRGNPRVRMPRPYIRRQSAANKFQVVCQ